MADPRIKYDIVAHAEGGGEVERLAQSLEKLDHAIDPAAAARAAELTSALQRLGAQQEAVRRFQELSASTDQARASLTAADAALEQMRGELQAGAAPTTAQAGRLDKLAAAAAAARADVQAQTVALEASRGRLAAFGIDASDAAAAEQRLAQNAALLRDALQSLGSALPGVQAGRLVEDLRQLGDQRQAIEQFRALDAAVDKTRATLRQAEQTFAAHTARITAAGPPTQAQVQQQQRLAFAVDDARAKLAAQTASLSAASAGLQRMGVDAGNLAGAEARLATASQQAVSGIRALADQQQRQAPALSATAAAARQLADGYTRAGAAATSSAAAQTRAARTVSEGVAGIAAQLRQLQSIASVALGGSILGGIAADVGRTADAYTNLAARIRIVTGEGQTFETAFRGVFDVAQRTNSAVEETGQLFTRLAQQGKDAGLSAQQAVQQALSLIETINQAIQLSGGGAQAAQAAITQLIQGLQSGVLRGEEFNSIMEQSPRLARALADGLGVTTGQLREMAKQGALTSDVVINALKGQAQAIETEFGKLPLTIGRALQNLGTEWTRYIGEADAGTGASVTAAKAITALATNLGAVADAAMLAGEAWIAYKAVDIAGALLRQVSATQAAAAAAVGSTAATTANTAAKGANAAAAGALVGSLRAATAARTADTAATAANTAAQAANAVAARSAAAAGAGIAGSLGVIGRLAGAVGLAGTAVALFGDVAVKAFRGAGTWIGEGAAKLAGYRDRSEEVLRRQTAHEAGARTAAQAQEAHNQKLEQAAEKALGLTGRAKELVSEFDALAKKGDTASQAAEKLSKNLQLGDVSGIAAAGAALDALAIKGKLTAEQVRKVWTDALKGEDLQAFETRARAAFDGTAQGVRRLTAALEAIDAEALRRLGTSAEELQTGFSQATTSAINDLDAMIAALGRLGEAGKEAEPQLVKALDRTIEAAGTERALKAVIERVVEMGAKGLISGEQVAAGLDKARKKADDLRAGINSVDEALRVFGIKSKAELQLTADRFGEAYQRIAGSAEVSLQDQARAFQQWRDAAIAANGGVESETIKLHDAMLKTRLEAAGLGDTIKTSMDGAAAATDRATQAQQRYARSTRDAANAAVDLMRDLRANTARDGYGLDSAAAKADWLRNFDRNKTDSFGDLLRDTKSGGVTRTGGGQFNPPDSSGDWVFDSAGYAAAVNNNRSGRGGPDASNFWRLTPAAVAKRQQDQQDWLAAARTNDAGGFNGNAGYSPFGWYDRQQAEARQQQQSPQRAGPSSAANYTTNITIGGRVESVRTVDQASADALLRVLEMQQRTAGG